MASFDYIDVEPITGLVRSASCLHQELGPTISRLFSELSAANPEAVIVSAPCVYYTGWHESTCEFEAVFPVDPSTVPGEGSSLKDYPSRTALMTVHTGPYEGLQAAWMQMWQYVEANGVQADMPCWDCYVLGPDQDQNPENWVTELYIPLKKL